MNTESYIDDYERKALLLANQKGFYSFSFEQRDNDEFEDEDEFNNFSLRGKKGQERKRQRDAGLSRKDARENVRDMKKGKEARNDLPDGTTPTGVQDLSKRTFVGNAIAVTTMAVPRGAFLSLLAGNYRGIANKLHETKNNPTYSAKWERVKTLWRRMGGQASTLERTIENGDKRKPLFCGAKCKSKMNFSNLEPATVTALIATGGGVLGSIVGVIGNIPLNKAKEQEIKNAKEIADQEYDRLSDQDKKNFDLAEKQLNDRLDPRKTIINNPNLSAQEKADALKIYDETVGNQSSLQMKQVIVYSLIGLVVIFAGVMIFKKLKIKK